MHLKTYLPKLISAIAVASGILISGGALSQQNLPHFGRVPAAPDDWLLGKGSPWFFTGQPSANPTKLTRRTPTPDEAKIVERAKALLINKSAKAIALIDGRNIVYMDFKSPVNAESTLMSFNVGNTVTGMAVGKAICAGRMTLNSAAGDLVPELKGKALGTATVRALLTMSSGTKDSGLDSTYFTTAQNEMWRNGTLNLLDALMEERVAGAKQTLLKTYEPGEEFWYKSSDPDTLGIMINRATNSTYAQWTTDNIFRPAGMAGPVTIGQDKFGHGQASGNVRLTMEDWIRYAAWARENANMKGCFGDYLRAAAVTQVKNHSKKFGQLFGAYGYLTWTENQYAPGTYWAVGHGGQRIGWSQSNNRMIVVFSSMEDWMPELYGLFASWSKLQ
jgi:CubicO group peptidase (beta-lactamase class C family)